MNKYKKIIILLIFIAVSIFVTPIIKSEASELSSSQITEKQLDEIISRYGQENLIFENGFTLTYGDEIDLSKVINNEEITEFSSNNEFIFQVEGNKLIANNEGVTFLIGKSDSKYYVYQVYVADGTAMISNLGEDKPKDGYLVYVDAGHGGKDPGASGNGVIEKELNLIIASKIRDKLKNLDVKVVMNRETDVFVDYKDTATHANSVNPHVFVSIHNNASTNSSVNGIETFYTKEIDISYGKEIHSRLISYTGANDRKLKQDTYYVTNHTTMPAVLVEGGFVTNLEEANNLKKDDYQEKIANAVVDGIMEYLKNNVDLNPEEPGIPGPEEPGIPNPEEPEIPKPILKGWVLENNTWYYYNDNGVKANGWLKDNGVWYYLDNSGAMVKGWLNLNGVWYYLHNSGAMATGWLEVGGSWYYMHSSGVMATGWVSVGGSWYYMHKSGVMATGWVKLGDTWYYMHKSGVMATGWLNLGGTWYYLYNSGAMATDITIDGWYLDKNGVGTKL